MKRLIEAGEYIALGRMYETLEMIRSRCTQLVHEMGKHLDQRDCEQLDRIPEIANQTIGKLMNKYDRLQTDNRKATARTPEPRPSPTTGEGQQPTLTERLLVVFNAAKDVTVGLRADAETLAMAVEADDSYLAAIGRLVNAVEAAEAAKTEGE